MGNNILLETIDKMKKLSGIINENPVQPNQQLNINTIFNSIKEIGTKQNFLVLGKQMDSATMTNLWRQNKGNFGNNMVGAIAGELVGNGQGVNLTIISNNKEQILNVLSNLQNTYKIIISNKHVISLTRTNFFVNFDTYQPKEQEMSDLGWQINLSILINQQ